MNRNGKMLLQGNLIFIPHGFRKSDELSIMITTSTLITLLGWTSGNKCFNTKLSQITLKR